MSRGPRNEDAPVGPGRVFEAVGAVGPPISYIPRGAVAPPGVRPIAIPSRASRANRDRRLVQLSTAGWQVADLSDLTGLCPRQVRHITRSASPLPAAPETDPPLPGEVVCSADALEALEGLRTDRRRNGQHLYRDS